MGFNRISMTGPEACRRILLVGEMNPYGADPRYALYYEPSNSAGGRLQRVIFGVGARQWYLPMWRVNLCVGGWDDDVAADRAERLVSTAAPWDLVVMLGRKVAAAFGDVHGPLHLESFGSTRALGVHLDVGRVPLTPDGRPCDTTFVSLPHPSAQCRDWNQPDAVARAWDLMRHHAPEIPWGEIS